MEFSHRNSLTDQETNDMLRMIEKEHIELVLQDELETVTDIDGFQKR